MQGRPKETPRKLHTLGSRQSGRQTMTADLRIEPANEEEIAMIKEGMREYEKNPESFITLSEYKKSRGIKT